MWRVDTRVREVSDCCIDGAHQQRAACVFHSSVHARMPSTRQRWARSGTCSARDGRPLGTEPQSKHGKTPHRRVTQGGESSPQLSLHLRMFASNMFGANVITGSIVQVGDNEPGCLILGVELH